jgi:hypothetical protein
VLTRRSDISILFLVELIPITPGMKIMQTPNNSTVVKPDYDNTGKGFFSQRLEEINMSLLVDLESSDNKSAGENEFERWLFDTGASIHTTYNKQNLCNCKNITHVIRVAEGSMATVYKRGLIYLKSECGGIIKLLNVLYIPDIRKNIISVARLMQMNKYIFQCTKYHGTLSKGPYKILMKLEPLTGMWFLRGQGIVVASVLMVEDGLDNKSK